MKSFFYALIVSTCCISTAFAQQSENLVLTLEASAQTVLESAENSIDSALDAAINNASEHTTNPKALSILSWMKNNKTATILLGISSLAALDSLYHWAIFNSDQTDATWFETTVAHQHVVSNVKKMPTRCMSYALGLIAAVLIAQDLSRDEKTSYLKILFARLASNTNTPVVATTPETAPVIPAA